MRKALALLFLIIVLPAWARTITFTHLGQTLTYNVLDEQNKTCEVAKSNTTSGMLSIPSEILDSKSVGFTVVGIGEGALSNYGGSTVIIPPTVKKIGNKAFEYCFNLTSVQLPNSIQSIGESAFANCSKLEDISLSELSDLQTIGASAFWYCSSIGGSLTLPRNLSHIGESAFGQCSALTSVTILSDLDTIPAHAFDRCTSLAKVTLPTSLAVIGDYAFDSCAFTEINLPNSLKKISYCAFLYCEKLENISIPQACTEIGSTAFQYCTNLKNISLPTALTILPDYIFNGCFQLKGINLPNSIESIGRKAFGNAVRLQKISIPKSVTSISPQAFYNCPSIDSINIYADKVLEIEGSVFEVSNYATDGIYPKDIIRTAILRVPAHLYNSYKEAPVWGRFSHIEPISPILERMSLSKTKLTMLEGDSDTIKVFDYYKREIENGLLWKSYNESVVTVDANGVVKAVGLGNASISCKWVAPSGSVFMQDIEVDVRDCVLRINLPNGYTELQGAARNAYKFRFGCESGFHLHQVLIDDEDITSEINASTNYVYEFKPARKDRVMHVIYRAETTGIESAESSNVSKIKFKVTEGHIDIEGAQADSEIKIYDINGRILKRTTIHSIDTDYHGVIILSLEGQIYKFIM